MSKEAVAERGHKVPENYPFVLAEDLDSVAKTKELIQTLKSLKLDDELTRASKKTSELVR